MIKSHSLQNICFDLVLLFQDFNLLFTKFKLYILRLYFDISQLKIQLTSFD